MLRRVWSRTVTLYRQFRQKLQDQQLGRELVGVDRDGNKYYQYYSYYGLPTRREIRFKGDDIRMTDLVYYQWLYKQRVDPPSERQKEQFYLEQKLRYQRALEWDQKQEKLSLQMKARRQELLQRNPALLELDEQKAKQKIQLQLTSKRNN